MGTFELKLNDAQGAPMTFPGKYMVVWKKQKGGSWKAEADITPISTQRGLASRFLAAKVLKVCDLEDQTVRFVCRCRLRKV